MASGKVLAKDMDLIQQNVAKNYLTAQFYQQDSPGLAHHVLNIAERTKFKLGAGKIPRLPAGVTCQHCGVLFNPGNHSTRLQPRMRPTKRMLRLLQRHADSQRKQALSAFQLWLVSRFLNSTNRLVKNCHLCGKRTIVPGESRKQAEERKEKLRKSLLPPTPPAVPDAPLSKAAKKKKKKQKKYKMEESGQTLLEKLEAVRAKAKPAPSAAVQPQATGTEPNKPNKKKNIMHHLLVDSTPKEVQKKVKTKVKKRNEHLILKNMLKAQKGGGSHGNGRQTTSIQSFLDSV